MKTYKVHFFDNKTIEKFHVSLKAKSKAQAKKAALSIMVADEAIEFWCVEEVK